jgi:hypothetical protein
MNEQGTGWETPLTPSFGTPHTDVKVAGAPAAASTALLSPPGDGRPVDEVTDSDGVRPEGRRAGFSLGGRTLPKIAVVAAVAVVVVGGGGVAAFALTGSSGGTTAVAPSKPAGAQADPAKDAAAQQAAAAAVRRQQLDRAAQAARKAAAKHPALGVKGSPLPTPTPGDGGGGSDPIPAGEAQKIAKGMMADYDGFSGTGQFGCLVNLWNRESHWNTHAGRVNGPYGIPQANPGTNMVSAGADWKDSAQTQIKWGLKYIKGRYTTPCRAWQHSESVNWY